MTTRIALIEDEECAEALDGVHPVVGRARMTSSLIRSSHSDANLETFKALEIDESELLAFHSSEYLNTLRNSSCDDEEPSEEEEFGLAFDCPVMENMQHFCLKVASSSLTAADLLLSSRFKTVVNWYGGWHHAQRDSAEGFCYVNDIVLAVSRLRRKFDRVLYVDLDVHHGDGVENAFSFTKKVFTLSLHLKEAGFFPGTGSLNDIGFGQGKFYACNVPLKEGTSDQTFNRVFNSIFPHVFKSFNPDAMVIQCGADCLAMDPLGGFNLSSEAVLKCVKLIQTCDLPTLYLGGGGYVKENAARLWTLITAQLCGN